MLVKKVQDQVLISSPICGEIKEIIRGNDYAPLGLAVAIDIRPTQGHYHTTFDEIYFVLDGKLTLKLFDPISNDIWTEKLEANELIVISKGVHHRVIDSSDKNRLCVISVPPFHLDDEHDSNQI